MATTTTTTTATKNRPVSEHRFGSVKSMVWRNERENGPQFSVTLASVYRDKQGAWQETSSLSRDGCLQAVQVLQQAALWIAAQPKRKEEAAQTK